MAQTSFPVRPLLQTTFEVGQIEARLLQSKNGGVHPLNTFTGQLSQLARLPERLDFGCVSGERRIEARAWRRSLFRHEGSSAGLQMASHLLPDGHKRRLQRSLQRGWQWQARGPAEDHQIVAQSQQGPIER